MEKKFVERIQYNTAEAEFDTIIQILPPHYC